MATSNVNTNSLLKEDWKRGGIPQARDLGFIDRLNSSTTIFFFFAKKRKKKNVIYLFAIITYVTIRFLTLISAMFKLEENEYKFMTISSVWTRELYIYKGLPTT